MANVISEEKYFINIRIDDVTNLFTLYTDPYKFFKESGGVASGGYKKNYMKIYKSIFEDKPKVEPWHEKMLDDEYYKLDKWNPFIFRGQENTEWEPETSLYREYMKLGPKKKNEEDDLFIKEKMILREFQRNYNRFGVRNHINENDYYEWFSWMQHYGVPTRFLDFTHSFFVAVYFASKNISFEKKNTASFSIYAVHRLWLEKRYKDFLPDEILELYYGTNGDSFGKDPVIQEKVLNYKPRFKAVINMDPFNLNERLVQQRGIFLFPTDLSSTFMENLYSMLVYEDNKPIKSRIIKIDVKLSRNDLIYLYKQLNNMNINAQTLFENKLESMGEILKQKLLLSRHSDVLSLNSQRKK